MALPSIFNKEVSDSLILRLEKLKFDSTPLWGKMNTSQILAHLNVTYDLANGKKSSNSNFIVKFIVKTFIKNLVVNEVPYKRNSSTAPIFIITNERDFEVEKGLLIANIKDVQEKGSNYFEEKLSDSFGKLTSIEWNNMFYKHLEHHFTQLGI